MGLGVEQGQIRRGEEATGEGGQAQPGRYKVIGGQVTRTPGLEAFRGLGSVDGLSIGSTVWWLKVRARREGSGRLMKHEEGTHTPLLGRRATGELKPARGAARCRAGTRAGEAAQPHLLCEPLSAPLPGGSRAQLVHEALKVTPSGPPTGQGQQMKSPAPAFEDGSDGWSARLPQGCPAGWSPRRPPRSPVHDSTGCSFSLCPTTPPSSPGLPGITSKINDRPPTQASSRAQLLGEPKPSQGVGRCLMSVPEAATGDVGEAEDLDDRRRNSGPVGRPGVLAGVG